MEAIFLLYNENEKKTQFSVWSVCVPMCRIWHFTATCSKCQNGCSNSARMRPCSECSKTRRIQMVYLCGRCSAHSYVYTPALWIFMLNAIVNGMKPLALLTNDNLFHSIHRQSTCILLPIIIRIILFHGTWRWQRIISELYIYINTYNYRNITSWLGWLNRLQNTILFLFQMDKND